MISLPTAYVSECGKILAKASTRENKNVKFLDEDIKMFTQLLFGKTNKLFLVEITIKCHKRCMLPDFAQNVTSISLKFFFDMSLEGHYRLCYH